MKALNTFELARHDGPYDSWPLRTGLIRNGSATGKAIPGFVIEAQYEYRDGFLLVTSWDCPFEEAQTFLLLSRELDVLAEETIGAAYASVWMEGHEPIDDRAVLFHCDGDLDVLAKVDSANRLVLTRIDRSNGRESK